jgi:hypothetical protein
LKGRARIKSRSATEEMIALISQKTYARPIWYANPLKIQRKS